MSGGICPGGICPGVFVLEPVAYVFAENELCFQCTWNIRNKNTVCQIMVINEPAAVTRWQISS